MKKFLVIVLSWLMIFLLVACQATHGKDSAVKAKLKGYASFPEKPIKVIVAFKAGGGTDIGARILTSEAEKIWGKSVVVVNIPGKDGELGYTELAQAEPDGYTIGFINLPTFLSLPLDRDTKYKKEDVVPILNNVYDPGVIAVLASSEWKNIDEFVEYAKLHPEEITVSNNGIGSSDHIAAVEFEYETGIKVTHVPFGGGSDAITALRRGYVTTTFAKISEVAPMVKSGELRILASFTEKRLEDFSDIPTLTEKGYPVVFGSARALVAPKGTPNEIVEKLHDAFKAAMETPEYIEAAKDAELPIMYMSSEELIKYMNKNEEYLKNIKTKLGL